MKKTACIKMSWLIVAVMLIQMCVPVLAMAHDGGTILEIDGKQIQLAVNPIEDNIGLMASAYELSEAFGFEYDYDIKTKAFTIHDDVNGEVVLMHNATQFFSGEHVYDCAPYFYEKDGEPMVEVGFFCVMYGSSYNYEGNKIVIYKNVLDKSVAKVSIDGNEVPLLIEPFETKLGLVTDLQSVAGAFGLEYEYDEETEQATLYSDEFGTVKLTNGATEFTSDQGVFECAPHFFVENDIPLITIRFFCAMFSASYDYDEENHRVTIYKDKPMQVEDESKLYFATGDSKIEGKILLDEVYASDLSVTLFLQRLTTRSDMYGYSTIGANGMYELGKVSIPANYTSKNFSFDVSSYYSSTNHSYAIYFEVEETLKRGYVDRYLTTQEISTSPYDVYYFDSYSKQFSYGTVNTFDIKIPTSKTLTGYVQLADGKKGPSTGLPVSVTIQTRSSTRSQLYGSSYYTVGANYDLCTVDLANVNQKVFTCPVEQWYTSSYPYYNVFYSAPGYNNIVPYGYVNNYSEITEMDGPLEYVYSGQYGSYPAAKTFSFSSNQYVDIDIQSKSTDVPVTSIVINNSADSVYVGQKTIVSATTYPAGALNATVIWESSNTSLAYVDQDGVVTAFREGTVVIYAYNADRTVRASKTITIKPIPEDAPVVSLSNVTGKPGKTVSVDVKLDGCNGFANLELQVNYNSQYMKLLSVTPESSIGGTFTTAPSYSKNPYNFGWSNTRNLYADGKIATLKFEIYEDAPEGYYPVVVSCYEGINGMYTDGYDVNYDENMIGLGLVYKSAGIEVKDYNAGDIDGDNIVNSRDAINFLRYLAGWDIDGLVIERMDTDGNGTINDKDGTYLLRYLAGWDIELH